MQGVTKKQQTLIYDLCQQCSDCKHSRRFFCTKVVLQGFSVLEFYVRFTLFHLAMDAYYAVHHRSTRAQMARNVAWQQSVHVRTVEFRTFFCIYLSLQSGFSSCSMSCRFWVTVFSKLDVKSGTIFMYCS